VVKPRVVIPDEVGSNPTALFSGLCDTLRLPAWMDAYGRLSWGMTAVFG
jgi:hypothetical protein